MRIGGRHLFTGLFTHLLDRKRNLGRFLYNRLRLYIRNEAKGKCTQGEGNKENTFIKGRYRSENAAKEALSFSKSISIIPLFRNLFKQTPENSSIFT